MSGHSKWKNILHKKGATDAKRAKIFTKIGREIAIAIREGGADPASNSKLRDIVAKAKINNVPNDNINRMIEKYSNAGDSAAFETMIYEGYGPAGVAIIVETLTDNKNRTAGDIRHYFDKYGGNLGAANCVSWQFETKGKIIIDELSVNMSEDNFLMLCIELGADDIIKDGEYEITTSPENFSIVRKELEDKGFEFIYADISKIPNNYVKITNEDDIKNMEKLLDILEDNDDVQNVCHNLEDAE